MSTASVNSFPPPSATSTRPVNVPLKNKAAPSSEEDDPKTVSRSTGPTFQILILAYEDFVTWGMSHPEVKELHKSYPTVSYQAIHNGLRKAGLHRIARPQQDAHIQWMIDRSLMYSRHCDEKEGFTGCLHTELKGKTAYFKLLNTEIVPEKCSVRDLIMEDRNQEYWETLVVYAFLDQLRLDTEIREATGLTMHAIEKARQTIKKGFPVWDPKDGVLRTIKSALKYETVTGTRTRRWERIPDSTPPQPPLLVPSTDEGAAELAVAETAPLVLVTPPLAQGNPNTNLIPVSLLTRLEKAERECGLSGSTLVYRWLDTGLQLLEEQIAFVQVKKEEASRAKEEASRAEEEASRAVAALQSLAQTVPS